jgi:hypothetical protein
MNIQDVATKNDTSKLVFSFLSDRKRYRTKTDLSMLYRTLVLLKPNLDYSEFLRVFVDLQSIGAGSIIYGRKTNPDRFAWDYNLKELAYAAARGISINLLRKLPKGSPSTPMNRRANDNQAYVGSIVIPISSKIKPSDLSAFLELAASMTR